jgi:hypothetical protein
VTGTATRCARHPEVETGLSCGRCGTPICPRCLVMTDVGARCPDCAPSRRLPQFELGPLWILRGSVAAIVSGVVLGAVWGGLIMGFIGFFTILIGAGIGWLVSEAVGWATNRKSGPPLQVVASIGVLAAYMVRNVIRDLPAVPTDDLFGYIAVIVGIIVAINRLRF